MELFLEARTFDWLSISILDISHYI